MRQLVLGYWAHQLHDRRGQRRGPGALHAEAVEALEVLELEALDLVGLAGEGLHHADVAEHLLEGAAAGGCRLRLLAVHLGMVGGFTARTTKGAADQAPGLEVQSM